MPNTFILKLSFFFIFYIILYIFNYRSNSVPIIANKEQYLACIEECVSPKSTFIDIDQSTPPKSISLIEPNSFSPVKTPQITSTVPYKSRGKTLRRMVSSMSGLRKIAIPKDAVLSSDDEVGTSVNRKIKLIHVTPEFKNELRRSNRIAKAPIRNLKVFNNDGNASDDPVTSDTIKTAELIQPVVVSSQVISKPKDDPIPLKDPIKDSGMDDIEKKIYSEKITEVKNTATEENKDSELIETINSELVKNKKSLILSEIKDIADKEKDSDLVKEDCQLADDKNSVLVILPEIPTKSLDAIQLSESSVDILNNNSKLVDEVKENSKQDNCTATITKIVDKTKVESIEKDNIQVVITKKKDKDIVGITKKKEKNIVDISTSNNIPVMTIKTSSSKSNISKQKKKEKIAKLKSQIISNKTEDLSKCTTAQELPNDVAESRDKSTLNLKKKSHKHSKKSDRKLSKERKPMPIDNEPSKSSEIEVKKKTLRLLQPSELVLLPFMNPKSSKAKKHPNRKVTSKTSAPPTNSLYTILLH